MSALGRKQTFASQKVMSALPRKRTCAVQLGMSALGQKRTHAAQQKDSLFDNQVSAAKQRKRYGKAEGLGGFQIDDQLDLGGLLNWKIGRLLPLENSAGVYAEQTVRLLEIGSVAHETAGDRKLAERIYGWYCMAGRQLDQPITLGQKKYFTAYHKCTYPLTAKDLESRFDLAGTTGIQNHQARAEGTCRVLYGRPFRRGLGDVSRVDEDRDRRSRRHQAVHQLKAFFE